MFSSRIGALRVSLLLAVLLGAAGHFLTGPLTRFIVQPARHNIRPVAMNVADPFTSHLRTMLGFAGIGVAVALGALIWCRFARQAPYLRRSLLLLPLALLGSAAMVVLARLQFASAMFSLPTLGVSPLVTPEALRLWRIPLVGAVGAVLLGTILAVLAQGAGPGKGQQ